MCFNIGSSYNSNNSDSNSDHSHILAITDEGSKNVV